MGGGRAREREREPATFRLTTGTWVPGVWVSKGVDDHGSVSQYSRCCLGPLPVVGREGDASWVSGLLHAMWPGLCSLIGDGRGDPLRVRLMSNRCVGPGSPSCEQRTMHCTSRRVMRMRLSWDLLFRERRLPWIGNTLHVMGMYPAIEVNQTAPGTTELLSTMCCPCSAGLSHVLSLGTGPWRQVRQVQRDPQQALAGSTRSETSPILQLEMFECCLVPRCGVFGLPRCTVGTVPMCLRCMLGALCCWWCRHNCNTLQAISRW